MSFAWPWVFLLLPLPWLLPKHYKKNRPIDTVRLPPHIAKALTEVESGTSEQKKIARFLPWLAWGLFILALSQPFVTGDAAVQAANGRAIAMAIDVSGSMSRTDFIINDEETDRLTAVKRVAGEFIQARKGDRLGLVLFGNEAFVASPLSFDVTAIANNLGTAGIGMAGRSTAIGDGLGLAIKLLNEDPAAQKAIILLSDGTNNSGTTEPESAAELAASFGIRIHTIAMGSDKKKGGFATSPSADLDEETLQQIATSASGSYHRVRNYDDLINVYQDLATLTSAESDTPPVLLKRHLGSVALLCLFIVLLLMFCLQWSGATARPAA